MKTTSLEKIQQLVLDIIAIERSHPIPGTDRKENVVEHTFSVTMLCWRVFEAVQPPLDITKIFKYALVHDFSERGYKTDVNTYAKGDERAAKKQREALEREKISNEFQDFPDFVHMLNGYETMADEEALFVWSVDKMQAVILGGSIDKWRPYAAHQVRYEAFYQKMEEFLTRCSPHVQDVFRELVDQSYTTYYDRPKP